LWARLDNRFVWLALITSVVLGLTGFIDDYRKWKKLGGHARGLSAGYKILAQMSLAIGIVGYLYLSPPNPEYVTQLSVPYMKNLFIDIGFFYIVMAVLMIVGSSNAFNLTDGLDGLAIGSMVVSALTLLVFAYVAGHAKLSGYLRIIPVPGAGELAVFLGAVVGSSLGFLWYNAYPAEVFMGDTGSLFLGGVLGLVAVVIKQELVFAVVGGLFAAEALSVLLQVYAFRRHGKRIFKMAPLHHHFELSGWPESKVTIRFWIVSIMLALIALTSLKLR
jgi:phospho-N-acetylmuramoyl-pentapeptide-transferase